jgi:hypothetical protein
LGTYSLNKAQHHQQAELAQLVARPTEDRKVTRSIRVHGTLYFLLSSAFHPKGGVAKWSTAVDSNQVQHQLLFEGAGSNPVSVAFLLLLLLSLLLSRSCLLLLRHIQQKRSW